MAGRGNYNAPKEDVCRMKRMMDGYGPHLMLDLSECNPAVLDDLDACFNLLNELPDRIGMTKITQPYVFRYRGRAETGS